MEQTLTAPSNAEAGDALRDVVIATAIEAFRDTAFHLVCLDTVADRAGMTLDEVHRCFPHRDDLVYAVTRTWYARRMAPILPIAERAGAVAFLRAIIVANIADPALMRFLSALVNIAATEDHPLSPMLQQQWLHFHALVQRALAGDVAEGREPDGIDVARGAEQLIALYEGLQLQAMVRSSMNLLGAYDRAVSRLREGWARPLVPLVWDV